MFLVTPPRLQAAERIVWERREDLASSLDVKVEEFTGRVSGSQPQREEAARGRSADKIEIRSD